MKHQKALLLLFAIVLSGLILVAGISFRALANPTLIPIFKTIQSLGGSMDIPSPTIDQSSPIITPQAQQAASTSTPEPTSQALQHFATLTGEPTPTAGAGGVFVSNNSLEFPIRAAFYYPWFPEGWTQSKISPYTQYMPSLGYYDQSDPDVISEQIGAMQYGNIDAGITSWDGPGSTTDARIPLLLSSAQGTNFKWAVYYESEGLGNPDVVSLTADLIYLRDHYSKDPAYLRIDNQFVVFVFADAGDGCGMADRWKQANTVNAYIVLKVFPGFQRCPSQPDGWHQYQPIISEVSEGKYSFTISPGYWKAGGSPQLNRNIQAWQKSIQDMVNSNADFQLITSFNEWGEGTAVESATQWDSASGFGSYLDALHEVEASYVHFLPTVINNSPSDPVVFAAGDIASCTSVGDELTAALLKNRHGTVIALGDNAYESGTIDEFNQCYDPSWGQFKAETQPVAGNHDYITQDGAGYYSYYGAAAGDPSKGYYSFDIGSWHIIVLNSNCTDVGGCDQGSPQVNWLTADLASHTNLCTMAVWHQPRFSSGQNGNFTRSDTFWKLLYQYGAELVLSGHDHDYERFAALDGSGAPDPSFGIRQFVVGTGGKNLTSINAPIANSEVQNDSTWGVLRLSLHPSGYDWNFIPVAGETFTDSGSGDCHTAP